MSKDHMKEMDKMLDKSLGVITEGESKLALFKGKEIRKIFHDNEWHYSIIDVIAAIIENKIPRNYWSDLKGKLVEEEGFIQLHEKIVQLKMMSKDGKQRKTDTADVETLFRIIQSIPSKKAEVFKRWLAKVGYERIQETQNPEIGIKRSMAQYKANGRSDKWIDQRMMGLSIRKNLTGEWKKRGVENKQYGVLTNTLSKGAFDVDIKQHRGIKNLKGHHSLRDNMSTMELLVMGVAEETTRDMAETKNAQGFRENLDAAKRGGNIASKTRKNIEDEIGRSVVTKQNFIGKK